MQYHLRRSCRYATRSPIFPAGSGVGPHKGRLQSLADSASGGVGTYAVQIAKVLGTRVTAVCSNRNTDLVKALGADKAIDYTLGDFRRTAGAFDVVFDIASYEIPRSCSQLMGDKGIFISTLGMPRA